MPRGAISVTCCVQMLQLWHGFVVSALWRATVLQRGSGWFHTARLTLVAVEGYDWDVLPFLPGAQTLPRQTTTCWALEKSHIGSALWEWCDGKGSYVCVFVEFSNGLSQWHIEARTVLRRCVLCNLNCAENWQNIFGYWGLYLFLYIHVCLCVIWVHVLHFQYGSCTEKLMGQFLPDHIWILVLIVHTLTMLSPDLLPDLLVFIIYTN